MKINRIRDVRPESPDTPVTLKISGNIFEVRYMASTHAVPIQKLDREHGLDLRTGEVIDFKHHASRAEDIASVAQSLKRLRDLINANLADPDTALWVTLTYRENMTDATRLYEDYRRFWQRFCYYLRKSQQPKAEYIAAAEPQGRGAWHLHCLLLFPCIAPFLPNAEIAAIWRHGFTKTKRLRGIDNPGLYLTAYLGDMDLLEAIRFGVTGGAIREANVIDEQGVQRKKAFVKGARLRLYPPGFNLYRSSRGVQHPLVFKTTEGEAQALIGEATLTYEKTVSITDASGDIKNIISYRQYSRNRKE